MSHVFSPTPSKLAGLASLSSILAVSGSCDGVERAGPSTAVAVQVAPLSLPGLGDVCYDLRVTNAPGGGGQVVWAAGDPAVDGDSDAICASQYGNGPGAGVTFVGSCDASPVSAGASTRTNSVTLWVDVLRDTAGAPIEPAGDNGWQDPCPSGCTLDVDCVENQDTLVQFNISILRQANQGFFDIGVNFEDIFCSAKVDCKDAEGKPIDLLFREGQRDTTIVSALACTAGPGNNVRTILYREPLTLSCLGREPIILPASTLVGNGFVPANPDPDPTDALWQYAVYTGEESLTCAGSPCNKIYWNIALGLDETIDDCTLTTRMSASSDGRFSDLTTPAGTVYPYIDVDVQLTDADGLKCTRHPLNGEDGGVVTRYTSVTGAVPYASLYSGPDECAANPCEHGGTCSDLVNAFTCTCATGFSGPTCATNIDDCTPNPCQNGGTCSDGVNAYTCACAPGFTGATCATNINECASNPCQNGGACTDGVNSFTCACAPGFTGTTCTTNINECASNPCQNGGTCTDGVNSYTCTCAAGFTGPTCGTATTPSLASGSGGGVFNYVTTSGSYSGGLWGGTHTFASSGLLTQFMDCCTPSVSMTNGTSTDFGSDGIISWGRWATGTVGGTNALRTMTYAVGSGALNPTGTSHYKTFNAFASTAPVIVNGATLVATGSANAVTGSVTTSIASMKNSTGGTVTYQLSIPVGGTTFTISGTANQYSYTGFLGSTSTISGTGGACTPSCAGIIPWADAAMGFITGLSAQRIGINYTFNSSLGRVMGAVVFQ